MEQWQKLLSGSVVKVEDLPFLPDTSDEYKEQSDGLKYFKSFIGRDEMPNYEKKILDDEDRWAVIIYIETLE